MAIDKSIIAFGLGGLVAGGVAGAFLFPNEVEKEIPVEVEKIVNQTIVNLSARHPNCASQLKYLISKKKK